MIRVRHLKNRHSPLAVSAERTTVPRAARRNGILAGSFLKQLLPQNLDTEDLLIVILLLLMAGDNGKEQNSALLTLALYLFL